MNDSEDSVPLHTSVNVVAVKEGVEEGAVLLCNAGSVQEQARVHACDALRGRGAAEDAREICRPGNQNITERVKVTVTASSAMQCGGKD